jgi:hypothetical protein
MEPGNPTTMVAPDRVDVWTGDQSPNRALLHAADAAGEPRGHRKALCDLDRLIPAIDESVPK